jgi:hypothetical protein
LSSTYALKRWWMNKTHSLSADCSCSRLHCGASKRSSRSGRYDHQIEARDRSPAPFVVTVAAVGREPLLVALPDRSAPDGSSQLPPALPLCYTKSMKKTIRVKQKVMGRPRTGITPLMGFRADPVIRASIVRWAERQPDMPTLSEAIRRLVELGLKVMTPAPPVNKPGRRLRAQELATKAIEKIIDPAAPPEERAQRRRRLTKGPEEFREARIDRQKK